MQASDGHLRAARDFVSFFSRYVGDKRSLRDAARQTDCVPVLVTIARSFPSDVVLLRDAFDALNKLMFNHNGNKNEAGRAGAASTIVDALKRPHSHEQSSVLLQFAAVEALACLVVDHDENKRIAAQYEAVHVILGLAADVSAEVKLRCCALDALERLMRNHSDNKSIAGNAHAARDLSSIMQDTGIDMQLRCKSAEAITCLVMNHSQNKVKAGHTTVAAVTKALHGAPSGSELQSKAIDAIAAVVVYQPTLQSAAVAAGALQCLLPIALSSCELRSSADDAIYCIVNCNFRNQQLLYAELQGRHETHAFPPKLQKRALDLDAVFRSGGLLQQLKNWCSSIVVGGRMQQQQCDRVLTAAEEAPQVEVATIEDLDGDDYVGGGIGEDSTPSVPQGLKQFGGTCYAFACVRSFNHRYKCTRREISLVGFA